MTLCGIWHGAGWPFLLWGFYHGVLIAGYHTLTYRQRTSAPPASAGTPAAWKNVLATLVTFGLVMLGWLFFRSGTTAQALGLFQRAVMPWAYGFRALSGTFYLHTAVLVLLVWLAPVAARLWVSLANRPQTAPSLARDLLGWAMQGGLVGVMLVLCMIYLRGQTAFIYFQF
jgi:hypothetical protein